MAGFAQDGGIVTTDFSGSKEGALDLVVQPEGQVVLSGYCTVGGKYAFAVARYNADGTIDTSFGNTGTQSTAFDGAQAIAHGLAQQGDGKIVLAGERQLGDSATFTVVRYNADGSLDTGFSEDGKLTTAFSTGSSAGYAVAVQSDGKILVAGKVWNGKDYDFALVRYDTDGSLDTSFSGDGKLSTHLGGNEEAVSIYLQSDGKILLAGHSNDGHDYDIALVRYDTDGSLDTGFGVDGKLLTDIGTKGGFGSTQLTSEDFVADIKVSATGKIYVGGISSIGSAYDFSLTRFSADGILEGSVTTDFGTANAFASKLAIQTDGNIILSGYYGSAGKHDFALARYSAIDSSLDTSFDGDGRVTTDIKGKSDMATGIALLEGGGLLVAGQTGAESINFALARYNADGSLAATTTTTGTAKANTLKGNGTADIMYGLGGNDNVSGGSGNDTLYGGDGKDTISGGEGADDLIGGGSADKLTGGGGADRFILDVLETKTVDAITDFTEADTLVFAQSAFMKLENATSENLAINKKAAELDLDDYLIYDSKTGKLYYDEDGSGSIAAIQIAGIKGAGAKTLSFDDLAFL